MSLGNSYLPRERAIKLHARRCIVRNNFIFANHSMRTVITALQKNLATLHATQNLMALEDDIAPVSEIFRLQNVQELKASETLYLPNQQNDAPRALVARHRLVNQALGEMIGAEIHALGLRTLAPSEWSSE